jgi:hypothetical protein
LQIASSELVARSQASLAAGARLQLEVVKGLPAPELRILHLPTAHERQQTAVRSAMARQLPPAEVRQTVSELRVQAQSANQIEGLRRFASIVQDAGLRLNQLSPAQLQRAITHSGLFHEARLAGAAPIDAADTKTRLLQLLLGLQTDAAPSAKNARLPPPGPEQTAAARDPGGDSLLNRLIRLIEGSIARIQLQQTAALPAEDSQRQAWQIDLPVHLAEETNEAMLRVEREASTQEPDATATWAVNLAFQFDTIGTLQCRIALAGERVSATFWCERDNTQQQVEHRLPSLREAFEAQGLEVVHLAGVLGEPPEPLIRVPMPQTLLDERA